MYNVIKINTGQTKMSVLNKTNNNIASQYLIRGDKEGERTHGT